MPNSTMNVTTTAAAIRSQSGSRSHLSVRNPTGSGATIYIGDANVSASNYTFALAPGDAPWIADNVWGVPVAGADWYAVAASGTATGICVLERV